MPVTLVKAQIWNLLVTGSSLTAGGVFQQAPHSKLLAWV